MVFDYPAKSGKRRIQAVVDPLALRRSSARSSAAAAAGRSCWPTATAAAGGTCAPRHQRLPQGGDRRRLLRQGLPDLERDRARGGRARRLRPRPRHARPRASGAITRAIKETAHYLGNTPAVCRASYIDPRIFDAYQGGLVLDRDVLADALDAEPGSLPTHHPRIERAVLDLIDDLEASPRGRRWRPRSQGSRPAAGVAGRRAASQRVVRRWASAVGRRVGGATGSGGTAGVGLRRGRSAWPARPAGGPPGRTDITPPPFRIRRRTASPATSG